VGVAATVGIEVGAEVAFGTETAAMSVILVMMLALQVSLAPPTFPVPLHWLIVIGIVALTKDWGSTVQCTAPPPPLPDPLH